MNSRKDKTQGFMLFEMGMCFIEPASVGQMLMGLKCGVEKKHAANGVSCHSLETRYFLIYFLYQYRNS